jgi:hypothetical protein
MEIDTYNTILQVGKQIDAHPELMLTTAEMAWGNILSLWWLYWILMRRWWGALLIVMQGGQWTALLVSSITWTVLLVGHLTVRPSSLLIVMAQEDMKVLGVEGGDMGRVWKELCYRKTEMLGDLEEAARWWWNILV